MKISIIQAIALSVLFLFLGGIIALSVDDFMESLKCPEINCPDLQPVVDSLSFELNELKDKCAQWHKEAEMFKETVRIEGEMNR